MVASSLPKPVKALARGVRRIHGLAAMNLGRISSSAPISKHWGYDRGTPIDRYYIENFLAAHADDVRGRVLEVQEDDYTRRFGGTDVTASEVLNLDSSNPRATMIGDLSDPSTLPRESFDCIILTQTLHLVFDMAAAVKNVREALRPGGIALVTVPGITRVEPGPGYEWHWSLTSDSLRRLLEASFDPAKIEHSAYGNLFAATAFLHGAAVQEVPTRKLDRFDPTYPVVVAARAVA
jgi:SAM-dependent methyltransferase